MTEITRVSLENEMDIVVAHKRMIGVAQFFYLTLSTQSTIATAVAEVSRVVIDKTDQGWLSIGIEKTGDKFSLIGQIAFPSQVEVRSSEEGLKYAQLLVPEFKFDKQKDASIVQVGIGIPRSLKVSDTRVNEAAEFFRVTQPTPPYEKLKLRNNLLNQQAIEKDEELKHSRILDEKKNEFISVASHELKTPLTSIMAFTKLAVAASQTEATPKIQHYLDKIDHQVFKLHQLIQQLLDISKIESGKLDYNMQRQDWNGYMVDMMPILEHLVPSHKLSWQPCTAAVLVSMDILRIEQVLTNLVGNAAKYSNPDTAIAIQCSSDEDNLTVCVHDEGIGISPQNLDRLFDKYFREEAVADKYSGFGMGLYITSGIVREHKGAIWAEKNKEAGSSFYFTLPLSKV
ncbi:MAG: HAMP domain-containing histidine kinase [Bacteroidetes bacterium]|nr:HAMP domain-containing histidine kinase [Bacteroidota bacterium]